MTYSTTYSITGFGSIIKWRSRTDAYLNALRQAITTDSVVLDIGTGTGIFALSACRFGARRVFAVEPGECIQVARQIAAANGYDDRIQFIQDYSTTVTLPERANVIVSDLRGTLPFFEHLVESIADARNRHLAPGGILIPLRDIVWVALVEWPEKYEDITSPWESTYEQLNMTAARHFAVNSLHRASVNTEQIIGSPQELISWDYMNVTNPDVDKTINWTVSRSGTIHGLIVWFDADIAKGLEFSNAPGAPETMYGQLFFPFEKPVSVVAGDQVTANVRADLVADDYAWRWETTVINQAAPTNASAHFTQSTFYGSPLSLRSLRKQEAGYIPALNADGEVDSFIVSRMNGRTSVGDIARSLMAQYPLRYSNWRDALTKVGEVSKKYG